MSRFGSRLASWAMRQIGSYLGYTGRAANVVGKAPEAVVVAIKAICRTATAGGNSPRVIRWSSGRRWHHVGRLRRSCAWMHQCGLNIGPAELTQQRRGLRAELRRIGGRMGVALLRGRRRRVSRLGGHLN